MEQSIFVFPICGIDWNVLLCGFKFKLIPKACTVIFASVFFLLDFLMNLNKPNL